MIPKLLFGYQVWVLSTRAWKSRVSVARVLLGYRVLLEVARVQIQKPGRKNNVVPYVDTSSWTILPPLPQNSAFVLFSFRTLDPRATL